MPRLLPTVLCLVTLLGAACGGDAASAGAAGQPGEAVVSKVVDGDTLRVSIGGRDEAVRLIGIDTPETHGRGGLRECFGKEASAHMAKLAPPGTVVRLVRDAEARDRYGRLLAYVYRTSDDLFINMAMARDGFADAATFPPNIAHTDEFLGAVAEARNANRGLWQRCGSIDVPI